MLSANFAVQNRWSPYLFKNGAKSRNRLVIPPMATGTADSQGAVTLETIKHYQNLTQAGAGILFVEYTFVHNSGRSEFSQLALEDDKQIPSHRELASIIKKSGSLAGIQLVHGGAKSSIELTGGKLLGASPIVVPTKENKLEKPFEMPLNEIELYQSGMWKQQNEQPNADTTSSSFTAHMAMGLINGSLL